MILGAFIAGLYVLICGVLFIYQRSLIYFPQPRSDREASTLMTLPVGAETIHVSMHPHYGHKALIYFGGNAEDVSLDIPHLINAFPESAIYALHYPGYGGSSGTPSQQAIFVDALALFEKVQSEHSDVTVVGRSLGSGVAVWLASQRPVARLVLVTPFDALADAAENQFPFLPVRWLLLDKFESRRYAPLVTAPTRIIVAEDDEIVPRSSSDHLSKRFREGIVSFTVLPQVSHNTVQTSAQYWILLSSQ
jgi:pimeloyl-ACP methyl ester carboxylesterase